MKVRNKVTQLIEWASIVMFRLLSYCCNKVIKSEFEIITSEVINNIFNNDKCHAMLLKNECSIQNVWYICLMMYNSTNIDQQSEYSEVLKNI